MRKFLSVTLAAVAVLAMTTSAGAKEVSAELTVEVPGIVSQTTNATVYDDGTRLVQVASFANCPDGWVCLWASQNYTGAMIQFQDRGVWLNLSAYGFNDTAESWRNRTNDDARVAAGAGGAGDMRCLGQNNGYSTFGTFNDQASSIRIYKVNDIC